MSWLQAIVISIIVCLAEGRREFPRDFKFGAATASYQIEGAWNVSDKTPNIWDTFVREYPEKIADHSTGDVACDSYNKWEEDVEIAKELGLHFYRISLSWSRLLPSGSPNYISEDGKRYYNNVINALLAEGIEPVVTLYHWDLPQSLQDLGGWTNPLIADWFAKYARVAFSLFGDRVKTWLTLNEPIMFCDLAYNTAAHAPGIRSPGIGNYLCNRHAMLAHAKAWRIYDTQFRRKFKGKVSLSNHIMWLEPDTKKDTEAAEAARQLMAGMYSHPIFSKKGGWPPVIEKMVAQKSKEEGRSESRLPPFTRDEIKLIQGTFDFYGLNMYTSRTIVKAKKGEEIGSWPYMGAPDIGVHFSVRPEWENADTVWFYINPVGLRNQLKWLKDEYGDIDILITENGVATAAAGLDDQRRVDYYRDHLEQVYLSIKEDKVKVTGYTAWTMIDNFEWIDGYQTKFGLYHVDFEHPNRTRTPRASAKYYAGVIRNHSLDGDV